MVLMIFLLFGCLVNVCVYFDFLLGCCCVCLILGRFICLFVSFTWVLNYLSYVCCCSWLLFLIVRCVCWLLMCWFVCVIICWFAEGFRYVLFILVVVGVPTCFVALGVTPCWFCLFVGFGLLDLGFGWCLFGCDWLVTLEVWFCFQFKGLFGGFVLNWFC